MNSVDLMSLWSFVKSVLLCKSVRNRTYPLWKNNAPSVRKELTLYERRTHFLRNRIHFCEKRNADCFFRDCQDISLINLLSFRGKAQLVARRCPSTFENMPFKGQEDALLDAWRGLSLFCLITFWVTDGYCYLPILSCPFSKNEYNKILCKDFS